jgi:hypothetical protein
MLKSITMVYIISYNYKVNKVMLIEHVKCYRLLIKMKLNYDNI